MRLFKFGSKSAQFLLLGILLSCFYASGNLFAQPVEYYDNLLQTAIKSNVADTTLARMYYEYQYKVSISNVNKAIDYLNKAEKINIRIHNRFALSQVYSRLGQIYHQLQLYNIALTYLKQALDIQNSLHSEGSAAYTNSDIANVYFAIGQYDVAEPYYRKGLVVFKKIKDKWGLAVMYNNIALCKSMTGHMDSCFTYFMKAYQERKQLNDRYGINHSLSYFATYYNMMGDFNNSIKYYDIIIKDTRAWKNPPDYAIQLMADAQVGLYTNYDKINQRKTALTYLDAALNTYRTLNDVNGVIRVLSIKAGLEFDNKNYSAAEKHALEVYQYAQQHNLVNVAYRITKFLSNLYLTTKDIKKLTNIFEVYVAYTDSVIAQSISTDFTETHAAIQTYNKTMENAALKQREALTIKYLLIIASLLIIVLVMYFYVLITKKRSIHKLKSLANATFESIVIHDGGKIIEINDQFCELIGYSREEIIGKSYRNSSVVPDLSNMDQAVKSDKPEFYETQFVTKSGEQLEVEITSRPFQYMKKIVRLAAIRDITERKRFIKALIDNDKQLRNLNAMKDKLFSIIAHDLKNPFNAVIGFTDLLRHDITRYSYDELLEIITMIYDSSQNAHDLLTNLLEWARLQTGSITFNPTNHSLNKTLETVLSIVKSNSTAKQINIVNDVPTNITIYADNKMLTTIVLNILNNAIKFTPTNGSIYIRSIKDNVTTHIIISDTGVGMTPDAIANLFNISEVHSTPGTNNEQGTGLGLILCQELMIQHKGKIEVQSDVGNGTTFTLIFPDHTQTD